MEFSADRSVLMEALAKTQGIIDRKTTLQVMSNVLFETTEDGQATITCTDYDVMWEGTFPVEIVEPGMAASCGRQIFEAVRNFEDGRVILRTDGDQLQMTCGTGRTSFSTVPADDFPRMRRQTEVDAFVMPKALLKEMVERTAFSLSTDEARPALNGALFRVTRSPDASGIHLVMVTTDGHRLSKVERDLDGITMEQAPVEAIIHRKGIQELRRTLDGPDDEVEVSFVRSREVLFANDGGTLQVRQVDARYPNYEKAIPSTSPYKVNLPRERLSRVLNLCSGISAPKSNLTRLTFTEGRVEIVGSNPELGEARDEIPVDFHADPVTIGFNFRYLKEILGAIGDDEVEMEFGDAGSQSLFRSPTDGGLLFVVMPMRV